MSRVRADLKIVASKVPLGSRVLDLGCGDGQLLQWLFQNRGCTGTGVEHEPQSVLTVMRQGLPVLDLDIDTQLGQFADDSFDVVVLSRTLQAIKRPDLALIQMRKIAPRIIVTMPNFGYWKNRLRLLSGHMPQSKDLPFTWYESPNVKYSTLFDLEPLFAKSGLKIVERVMLNENGSAMKLQHFLPNLMAGSAIYMLRRSH